MAGVLRGLPEAQGVLCGSIVSGLRMRPGNWAGVYACWGTENREAAVRFVKGGPGNPRGGNVEVKVVDPSANPYFASAAILGLALDGIQRKAALPPETTTDPANSPIPTASAPGSCVLPRPRPKRLPHWIIPSWSAHILGDPAVDMVVAVRRHEQQRYGDLGPDQLAEKFRMAWSL